MMRERKSVALLGAFGILILLTTAWTGWQVATHRAEGVSASAFPSMTFGALVCVAVAKVGGDRRRLPPLHSPGWCLSLRSPRPDPGSGYWLNDSAHS